MIHHQLILALGALLSGWLPATAQTQVRSSEESSGAIVTLSRAAPTHLPQSTFLPSWPPGESPTDFTILPAAATYNSARSLRRLFPVEVFRTPFGKQTRVTVVRLWGGRLQLGGFASTSRSYGLSLTFRLGRAAHADRRVE